MKHKFAIIGLGIMERRMLENAMRHPAFEVRVDLISLNAS